MSETKNLWGGRFTGAADERFAAFNRSFGFDRRLFAADVTASIAHCAGLAQAGVLSAPEAESVKSALNGMLAEAARDENYFDSIHSQDVHSFIEARLVQLVGDTGRRLHTGRSRNDQVATAFRLWLRAEIDGLQATVRDVKAALIELAEKHVAAAIPGYTHLQCAQPVLLSHWCLAYFEMLQRDAERLQEVRCRVNRSPLGAAALAGTSYQIDREHVAQALGFESVARNSLDAVSDRDFCIEFAGACSIIMMHLSRLAEDIIVYASSEFDLFELSDAVATGSSLMPQKKNPDSMELVRGKAGRVFGHNLGLLVTMKGLPLAYNKDMQEDKEAVFDTLDTTRAALEISAIVLRNTRLREANAERRASSAYMNATELADYLVRKGVSFRQAHDLVGRLVLLAIEHGVQLEGLELAQFNSLSDLIDGDVYDALSLRSTLASKSQLGGTAPERVAAELKAARKRMKG